VRIVLRRTDGTEIHVEGDEESAVRVVRRLLAPEPPQVISGGAYHVVGDVPNRPGAFSQTLEGGRTWCGSEPLAVIGGGYDNTIPGNICASFC
jgi:hypothetical protein